MRIAIAKPDWGIVGGFEHVVDRVLTRLRASDHEVDLFELPVVRATAEVNGVPVPDEVWLEAPEFFRHAASLERFAALDLDSYDLVISTQPGSHAVRHERKLAIFYHHIRVAYDLEYLYAASGLPGADLAHPTARAIRRLDEPHLASIGIFLTPSETVRGRLRRYSGVSDDKMLPFLAGPISEPPPTDGSAELVLCVSRNEWPKRTELFVDAAFEGFDGRPAHLVGSGGYDPWLRWWVACRALGEPTPPPHCWTPPPYPLPIHTSAPVEVRGRVDDMTLADLYRRAACVVAPAFDEDYGLTAIEAQAAGVPVVVCTDGGGLAELVVDGETGRVVPPSGEAIADAVRDICGDRRRWLEMSEAARRHGTSFSWERSERQLMDAIEAVMA